MKKNLLKVKGVISTAALLAVMSVPSFGQDVEFHKMGSQTWQQELKQQAQDIAEKKEAQIKAQKDAYIERDYSAVGTSDWRDTLEIQKQVAKNQKIKEKELEQKRVIKVTAKGLKNIEVEKPTIAKLEPLRTKEYQTELKVKAKGLVKLEGITIREKEHQKDLEVQAKGLVDIETPKLEAKVLPALKEKKFSDTEEGVLSREEILERYICKKENQFKALEEKFTSFEKTITQSTLAMQNAITQLGIMNQNQNRYQVYNVPSLTDRYSHMYPMMMMQSMQNQMMMQNLNFNYNQSINSLMMSTMMNYQAPSMGQRQDAYTGSMNNFNNIQESYNPNRTMATDNGYQGAILPQMRFSPTSQMSYNFPETKMPVTPEVSTPIDTATESELQADLDSLQQDDGMTQKS